MGDSFLNFFANPMNATEEFLTEAFMEQGLVSQELIDQILAEAKEQAGSAGEDELNLLFFSLLLDQLGLSKEEVVNFLGCLLYTSPSPRD